MSAASPTNTPLLHNRYRILNRLGEGRLATVYRAEDERLRRQVLVHLLRTELLAQEHLRRRFEEEAQRGAQRSHPGLLEVYDSGEVGGRPYMVTEDVSGQPLAEAGLLSAAEALSAVRTVVSAVALAQSQSVPHPPVSSRNVWLLPGNRSVLLENWTIPAQEVTRDLAYYRAPERARGGPPTPATSVYALGILAWEAFVGRRPFDAPSAAAIEQLQLRGDVPLISQARPAIFSPELDRIVAQAVAADPNMRYASPTDFGRALDHYVDATSAQTGRLATLPATTSANVAFQPAPAPQAAGPAPQRRSFRRRAATKAAAEIAPPPPPPVLQEPASRTITAPAPHYEQRAVDQQIKREVRREMRRQGCQRALIKRSTQLLAAFLVLYGIYFGVSFAYDWVTGRIAQVDPMEWVTSRLPNPNDFIPSWLRDGELTATYRVTRPVNLRSSPGSAANETIIRVLDPGVRLQQLGPPEPDPDGQPYTWIRVVVLNDGTQGWVANLEAFLEKQ